MLRSLLFVPAKGKMLAKIGTLEADAYIIDLEDSIEEELKTNALYFVKEFLDQFHSEIPIYVRINADRISEEIEVLKEFNNIGFVLPKFEDINYYEAFEHVWKNHQTIALIETPMGIVNIEKIASATWVDAIAFGAEDYTAFTGIQNTPEMLIYPKSCIVTYAKAYRKTAIDTPSFRLDSIEEFEREIDMASKMGFDAKMAISPKHVGYINTTFKQKNIDEIVNIIEVYEKRGEAVQVINGKVYERMHIDALKRLLEG